MFITSQNKNSAFNLVELLVVIAVIAILAALLLVVISQAKARSLRMQCANNVRQMGLALQQFRLDYNFYPPELDPNEHSENRNWKSALAYEMNASSKVAWYNQGIWHCPAASRPSNPTWNSHADWGYNEYGYNREYGDSAC